MILSIVFTEFIIFYCRFSFLLALDVHASDQIELLKSEILKLNGTVDMLSKDNVLLKQENANTSRHMANLEKMMSDLQNKMSSLQARASHTVAFTVALSPSQTLGDDQVIEYDHIVTNIGNAYHHGHFTVPVKGLYMLTVTAMSVQGGVLAVQLVKDGTELGRAYGKPVDADSDTIVVMVSLEVGDIVWVKHFAGNPNQLIHGDLWNTFSGTLIKAM